MPECQRNVGLRGLVPEPGGPVTPPMGPVLRVPDTAATADSRFKPGSGENGVYLMRSNVLALLIVWLTATLAAPAWAQSSFPAPVWSTSPLGSFVSLADSDLASLQGSLPEVYVASRVDTSDWTVYDVTTAGGSGRLSSCQSLDSTGSRDNARDLDCMLRNMGDDALLYFPNGTYQFDRANDGGQLFRPHPNWDHRGIVCESQQAVLNLNGDHLNRVQLLEGEDATWGGASLAWGGGREGDSVLPVADPVSRGSIEAGEWVKIYANANSVQDSANRHYYVRVVASSDATDTVTIDRPLPDDFNGGGATIRSWVPAEEWVVRNCTVQMTQPDHQDLYYSWIIKFKHMAESEISGNRLIGGYRNHVLLEDTARILVASNDILDSHFDKATNGFALGDHHGSHTYWFDNFIRGVVTGMACTGSTFTTVAFNDFREHLPNPLFDAPCEGGDGNDCQVVDHSSAHGPTVGGGYTHCSNIPSNVLGQDGDPSCRGTRPSVVYSSLELHNQACSKSNFIRNYFGGGSVWMDNNNGPGRGNFLYGNILATGPESFDTSPGQPGDFFFRDAGGQLNGYRQDTIWANNVVNNFGTGMGYNAYGDGVQVHDNVIRGRCHDDDASGHDADGGVCSDDNSGDSSREAVNSVWQNNCVMNGQGGSNETHAFCGPYSRTMPSAPGYNDWPSFAVTPTSTAPFVGPEMGDPDQNTSCLPAAERFYGDCP